MQISELNLYKRKILIFIINLLFNTMFFFNYFISKVN